MSDKFPRITDYSYEPAFPHNMTKLEYFAAKAMSGFLEDKHIHSRLNLGDLSKQRIASECFNIAQAMLAESEKRRLQSKEDPPKEDS